MFRLTASSRATVSMLLAVTVSGALAWSGCSEDETPSPGTTPGADASATDATTNPDVTTATDAAAPDTAPACTDTPFDCTKTAGNTVVDDGGFGSADGGPPAEVPIDLRCTKLYSCWSNKTVATDHRNYAPAFTLYSDGSEKSRWLYLPPGSVIDTNGASGAGNGDGGTPDNWIFPVGTMVYKEFQLAGKRIETRRIWKASDTEFVYSVWRWSSDESTATLTYAGDLIPNAAKAGHMYEVPKPNACPQCHDGHKDKLLSIDTWSLGAPGATGITLTQLKAENRLSSWPWPTELAVPQDKTGQLHEAIGFYYNNCGFCHKPGRPSGSMHLYLPAAEALPGAGDGGGGGLPDGGAGLLAADTPLYKTAVGVNHSVQVTYPLAAGYQRIVPGDAGMSVIYKRDTTRDPDGGIAIGPAGAGQMPPTLVRTVDEAAVEKTRQWIEALDD